MATAAEGPRQLNTGLTYQCPYCGLPQDRVPTLEHEWVLLEPDTLVPAHEVPAERRWIPLSDGRVTVYAVCPPDTTQQARIEHLLVCPEQPLPDLLPWLTDMRRANARRVEGKTAGDITVLTEEQFPDAS